MDTDPDRGDTKEELERLRAENQKLRSLLRVDPPIEPATEEAESKPVRVLVLPDPLLHDGSGAGPKAMANVGQITIDHLRRSQPDCDWRAEFDLARIPLDAPCYRVGEAVRKMWDGEGPAPLTFLVEEDEDGERHLRRAVVEGERESEAFRAGYERALAETKELLDESQAAEDAGATHHAMWSLLAVDVILARLKLARLSFEEGREDWREALAERRPEYAPRGSPE